MRTSLPSDILASGACSYHGCAKRLLQSLSVTVTVSNRGTCSFSAHAVIRKWIPLSDPEDKMAGAKVIENSS